MSQAEARNLAGTLSHVINEIVNDGSKSVNNLQLSPRDHDQVRKWNGGELTRSNYLLHEAFSRIAQESPEAEAIDAWDGRMAYRDLEDESSKLGKQLIRDGVSPGSLVLLSFEKSRHAVVSWLAVLKAGAACVFLDPRQPAGRIRQIIAATGATHALSSASTISQLDDLRLNVRRVPLKPGHCNGSDAHASNGSVWPSRQPSDTAFVIFTSGSTGTPKGVSLTHAAIYTSTDDMAESFGVERLSRVLQFSSYTFDASVAEMITGLLRGACICIPSEADRLDRLQAYFQQTLTSWAILTPTVARLLDPTEISALTTLVLVGEPVKESDIKPWINAGVQVYNAYGPAEATFMATATPKPGAVVGRASCIGRGVNSRTWIMDLTGDRLVPVGGVGELVIESSVLATGYLNDPERTAESFLVNPPWALDSGTEKSAPTRFYRTGDLARYFEDGTLECLGRADTQIKIGGQRVELTDVEYHLRKNASTADSAVFYPQRGHFAKRLTAIIAVAPQASHVNGQDHASLQPLDENLVSDAKEWLLQSVASYMVPYFWLKIDSLPFTAAGKLDRNLLLKRLESLSPQDAAETPGSKANEHATSASDAEVTILDVCSNIFNVPTDRIDLDRSFFALGGDSITAMQVVSAFRRLDKALKVKDLLSSSSLRETASKIENLRAQPSIPEIRPGDRFPVSPIQQLFLDTAQSPSTRNHFHQSVFVKANQLLSPQVVEKSIADLVARHPMLRARFEQSSSGEWKQYISPVVEGAYLFHNHPDASSELQKIVMLKSRLTLSVTEGPLVRADLFQTDQGQFLSIVVHHLVVDLVSWRVILEELERALTEEAPQFNDSFPFLAWVNEQRGFSNALKVSQVLPHQVPGSYLNFWGVDKANNVYADVREKRFSIGAEETQDVLTDCHYALRTEPVDILLSALLLSFSKSFPERQLPAIFTEGHGREALSDHMDLSRTVGWFTTMYPIHPGDYRGILDLVARVKDARKRTPNNGFDYFSSAFLTSEGREAFKDHLPAEVVFNYEGRYQSMEKEFSLLQQESWTAGESLEDMSPNLQRFCLFEIAASVLADRLNFTFAWNSKMKHQDKIEVWLSSVPRAITEITQALKRSSRQLTLSDLGHFVDLDYLGLQSLTSTLLQIPGVHGLEDLDEVYPCSPMQESLALSQSRVDGVYEVNIVWEVTASDGATIDPGRLESAWHSVVARHAALRTVFIETSATVGMLDQVVLKSHRPRCEHLQARDGGSALEKLSSYPAKEKGLGTTQPLHRLLICSTDDGRAFLRFEVNHIVFDGMSSIPLLRDLSEAYNGNLVTRWGSPYADFIRYIRDPGLREQSILYWKEYLAGAEACIFPPLLDITNGESEQKFVPVPLGVDHATLQAQLARLEVTFPVLIQLVWSLVLRFYINGNQTVTGYLASGREAPVPGIDDAIGPFISMLLCYVDFTQQKSILEVLNKIQLDSINSSAYQASSLAEIKSSIGITGGTLFNAGISFMPLVDEKAQNGNKLVFDQKSINDPTEFEIALIVETGEDATKISIHYRTSLVSEGHASNIAETVNHILMEILKDPSRTPDEIPALSSNDLHQLWKWNETCIAPVDECVHHFVERVMAAHPDKEAIFSWDGSLSYRELDDLSRNLAQHLVGLGIGPEKIVPLCFEKSKWAVVSMLAVLRAGGCFVMLDPTHPDARVLSIAEEVEAEVLMCSPLTRPKFEAVRDKALVIETEFAYGLPPTDPNVPVCPTVTPDNAMYVVFTSGTTGAPKGSITSHRAYCTGFREHAWAIEVGPESRTLQFSAYSFDASVGDILTTLLVSGCICIPSEEDRSMEISTFIAKSRATWAGWTPSFASLVDPDTVPTLTVLLMAGEPLPASQVDAWVDRLKLLNIYGPSECSVACVVNKDVTRETNASNIGRGYRCVTWVVDENDHERLRPIGSAGELLIEGPILARGYLKRPEKTAEVFIDAPSWLKNGPHPRNNGLYKTGDLVRYNSDGTINFIGRKDTQLKINGQRVELGEIEHSLRSSIPPTAGPVVVELLKRSGAGEHDLLAAFVHVGTDDTSPEDPDDIIATEPQALERFQSLVKQIYETASSLPRYMSPHVFIPLKVLPITTAGKLDRRALQRVTSSLSREDLVSFTSSAKEAGRTPEELQLAEMWKKVLHVSSVGVYDHFFRLGGDSMAAMGLRSEARRNGLGISVSDIFSNPVLADMAKVMSSAASEAAEWVQPFSLLDTQDSTSDAIAETARECNVSLDAIEDIIPALPMQEALMALSSRQSSSQAYALHAPYKLPANLDETRFIEAWEQTTQVHTVLRSRILLRPKGSLLVILKDRISVTIHQGSLDEYLDKQKSQPFGSGTPLLRLGFVKYSHDRYFVFSAHHSVYDGWSTKLIWDTVLQHYNGETIAPPPQFQALAQKLRSAPRQTAEDYWRDVLIDPQGTPFPSVPASHRPVARSATSFKFRLPAASTFDRNVTAATLINAAWAIINAQYSGDPTATFGCTLSGRDFPLSGIEQLVGPTIVTVPRQYSVNGDQNLAEFLEYIQQVAIDSIPHQYLGLHAIQGVSSAAQEACDFSSLMVVHPDAALRLPFEELDITPVSLDIAEFHTYPLAVEFLPVGEDLTVDIKFDPDCIDLEIVKTMMGQFNHVLQSICSASATADVSSVMTVAPHDVERIITWNSSSINPVEACVHHLIEKKTKEQPDLPAVISHDASLSYAELDLWANQLAAQIISTGLVKPGDFVGLCLDKSARAVPSMIAVLKAGGAFLPLNPDHPPARLQSLLEEANAKLVLASPERVSSLSSSLPCTVMSVDDFDSSKPSASPSTEANPGHAAYLLFTSGSTGKPKGVVIEHRAWASAIAAQSSFFEFGPHIRMLQFSTYTFDAMIFEIFITLTSGGCVCAPSESERMNDLSAYITKHEVNALISTPSVTRLINPANVPTLKLVMVGGEPLAPSDIEAWLSQPGVTFVNAYGPTEACVMATARKVTLSDASSNIGGPIGTATWIVSPFTKTLAPIGAVGELCIEGPPLARGYLGDPERTNASFERDPPCLPSGANHRIYHTGDLVRYNADGTITFVGRRDGQVKLRGQRIEVGEIEENIRKFMSDNKAFKHVGVELFDSTGSRSNSFLVALLVMDVAYKHNTAGVGCASMMDPSNPSLLETAKTLQQQLRNVLPEYMVPSAYVALERLPTTASSKRDRVFVKACLSELSAQGQLFPATTSKVNGAGLVGKEKLLQEWWASVLDVKPESIGAGDHFFVLGGNSITAIRLAGLARSSNRRLLFEDIFSYPVLSAMATRIADDATLERAMPKPFELLTEAQLSSIFLHVLPLYGITREHVEDIYPCTPLQEGLMTVTARNPGAYISADTMDIPTSELKQLQSAWAQAFRNFELLRTRVILSHEHGSLQVVVRQEPIWHEASDVATFVKMVQDAHGYGKPMAHLGVVPTDDPSICRVVFSAHHSLYDGWSLSLIRQTIEDHILGEQSKPDAPPAVPFKLFIRHLLDQSTEEARSYWETRMAGLEAAPFPRAANDSKHQPLASSLLQRSFTLPRARNHGSVATTANVVRAAWSLVISHYTASPDTVFGSILTGRESSDIADVEKIAGPTISTVPTRITIDYNSTISDFLASVQQDAVDESRFCQIGLQNIARISPECHLSCNFGSLLVVQPPIGSGGKRKVPQLRQGPVASPKFFPQALVLDFQMPDGDGEVGLTMSYDPKILDEAQAEFVVSTFSAILRNLLTADPTERLRNLSAISSEHESKLTQTAGQPELKSIDACVHTLVQKQAEVNPSQAAIDAWDGSMTYAELDQASSSLARKLQGLGIGPEKAVPFLFESSRWAIVAMLAIWKAGGCFVPLDPKSPNQRLQHLLQATEARLILTSDLHATRCSELQCQAIVVDEETTSEQAELQVSTAQAPAKTHNTAYILFTSGTTGVPKGVVIEHKTLSSSLTSLAKYIGTGAESRALQFCAYTFDVMLLDIFCALISGGCVCVPSDHQRMNDLAGFVRDFQVDTTWFTTSLSRIINPDDVPSLKTVIMGGEAVLQSDVDRWAPKVRLISGYGPTEACIVTLIGELSPKRPANSVGGPVVCRVWVVNPLKGTELTPFGGVGELCVEGPCLAREYLGNPEATATAFIKSPAWLPGATAATRVYRTGDLVHYNADGTLSFVARKDSQVKIRGQRVELSEIEETIRRHIPGWLTVAVDIFTPEGNDKQILAAVFGTGDKFDQRTGSASPNPELVAFMKQLAREVKGLLAETLPAHMIPDAYLPLPRLPVQSSGKLDRRVLHTIVNSMTFKSIASYANSDDDRQPPQTESERVMARLWTTSLKISDASTISRSDNFFSLGGDSIMAMRLVALLRAEGYSLAVAQMFSSPTLAGMASKMQQLPKHGQQLTTAANPLPVDSESDVGLMKKMANQLGLASSRIEDVYPCTYMQEFFMEDTLQRPGSHVAQFIFALDNDINLQRFRAAVTRCANWFPILRTRLVRESGRLYQVVLSDTIPCSDHSGINLDAVVKEDKLNPMGLGDPLARVALVQKGRDSCAHLVWTLHHSLYDAWSLRLLLDTVNKAYIDESLRVAPQLSFKKFIEHVGSRDSAADRAFWARYLSGAGNSSLFGYAFIREPVKDLRADFHVPLPSKVRGTTLPATIASAWIQVVGCLTKSRDVTIGYLVTGRAAPIPGIQNCVGPAISKVPLRVRLQNGDSTADVSEKVQAELTRLMPFELSGLNNVKASSQDARDACRFPLDLTVHPRGTLSFEGEGIGMRFVGGEVATAPPGGLSVECTVKGDEIEVTAFWDQRAARKERVDELIEDFREALLAA
ncbi:nonribosomal peptide [Colletotrichum plurivorum]|uniref:Nonribosomal peptide n=1 Tax=Colletotrichum plurivorum TaxID=2175906 RepID=A0A8H6KSQ6_9PEZI|nr:nonribosomal peptide [Colletotrichum plurivorum]